MRKPGSTSRGASGSKTIATSAGSRAKPQRRKGRRKGRADLFLLRLPLRLCAFTRDSYFAISGANFIGGAVTFVVVTGCPLRNSITPSLIFGDDRNSGSL